MNAQTQPNQGRQENTIKIYLLPNLLTGCNLFCGFVALTKIVEARIGPDLPPELLLRGYFSIKVALGFILLACIFDLLDGRVARMGGVDSPFGREFDSLADLISFGVAPAFLVHRIVLKDVFVANPEIGWFIASIYLLCGAFRLARYNCLAMLPENRGAKDFVGFPIPSAAALVASLTLFIMWWDEKELVVGKWRYALPVLLLFLSGMMVSNVRYPSFKSLDLRSTSTFTKLLIVVLFIGFLVVVREKILPLVLPIIFTSYLLYGFIRPYISKRIRREIEETEDEETQAASA
ncbi:MAG: CDP-diacylglycerol--serine O-phosphatidyltransferase [Verrucomicrobiae bacterium]|nr:CDP-diacylglycerol--serine O-phosphatidyltransferase [Verrucomicrobiae bacterium]MCX7721480.1 CDP-diacylglycerol--serine O-phosphatidyltransferase [Verrucomicrobiae bacterium]MDW7979332.1 CDP-diacylglycerol--serine O-phosphatidyltransferase [Verrucomicrobiales bacterium]